MFLTWRSIDVIRLVIFLAKITPAAFPWKAFLVLRHSLMSSKRTISVLESGGNDYISSIAIIVRSTISSSTSSSTSATTSATTTSTVSWNLGAVVKGWRAPVPFWENGTMQWDTQVPLVDTQQIQLIFYLKSRESFLNWKWWRNDPIGLDRREWYLPHRMVENSKNLQPLDTFVNTLRSIEAPNKQDVILR